MILEILLGPGVVSPLMDETLQFGSPVALQRISAAFRRARGRFSALRLSVGHNGLSNLR